MDNILVLLAVISLEMIVLAEYCSLNKGHSCGVFFNMFLNLSYSYLSAYIFYILVVFLPQEKRQSHLSLGIYNHIIGIHNRIHKILLTIEFSGKTEIKTFAILQGARNDFNLDEIRKISKNIDPLTKPRILGESRYTNWYEYLTFESKLLQKDINRLTQYNVDLNHEIIESIEGLHMNIDSIDFEGRILGNRTLEYCANSLINLHDRSEILKDTYYNINKYRHRSKFLSKPRGNYK